MATLTRTLDLSKITDPAWWALLRDDGGDLRATNGSNVILPMHVIEFSKSLKKGVVNVLVDDAAVVRLWGGTGATAQPTDTDPDGQFAAYDPALIGYWPAGSGTDVTAASLLLGDTSKQGVDDTLYTGAMVTQVVDGDFFFPQCALPSSTGYTIEYWFFVNGADDAMTSILLGHDPIKTPTIGDFDNSLTTKAEWSGASGIADSSFVGVVWTDDGMGGIVETDSIGTASTTVDYHNGWHRLVATLINGALTGLTIDNTNYSASVTVPPGTGDTADMNQIFLQIAASSTGDSARIALLSIYNEKKDSTWISERYSGYVSPSGVTTLNVTAWPH